MGECCGCRIRFSRCPGPHELREQVHVSFECRARIFVMIVQQIVLGDCRFVMRFSECRPFIWFPWDSVIIITSISIPLLCRKEVWSTTTDVLAIWLAFFVVLGNCGGVVSHFLEFFCDLLVRALCQEAYLFAPGVNLSIRSWVKCLCQRRSNLGSASCPSSRCSRSSSI